MVTVVAYSKMKNSKGEEFISLTIQGKPEMVKSEESGRFYLTARKCNLPCTFDEVTATAMIGQQMPGQVVKVDCESYDYVVENTGEVLKLSHRWEYTPEENPVVSKVPNHSLNGVLA